MKVVLGILVVLCVASAVGGLTGIQAFSYSSLDGVQVTRYSTLGRVVVLCVSCLSAVAIHGCLKKRRYAWWIVTLGISFVAVSTTVTAVMAFRSQTSFSECLVRCIGDILIVGLLALLLFRFWIPKRREFNTLKAGVGNAGSYK